MRVLIVAGCVVNVELNGGLSRMLSGVRSSGSEGSDDTDGTACADDSIGDFDKIIGVDRGGLWVAQQDMPLAAAIGDFDSVTQEEFEQISAAAVEVSRLEQAKDPTDLEVALDYATSHFPTANFTILGALGGRLDHLITNYHLPIAKHFARFASQITLVDGQNLVRYYEPGTHAVPRIAGYHYIGFDQVGANSSLSIEHAKYPLKAGNTNREIWASNEFIDDTMTISFSQGFVIAIYSRD